MAGDANCKKEVHMPKSMNLGKKCGYCFYYSAFNYRFSTISKRIK